MESRGCKEESGTDVWGRRGGRRGDKRVRPAGRERAQDNGPFQCLAGGGVLGGVPALGRIPRDVGRTLRVRYARHPLDIEEVQAHIAAGKLPTKLALTWDGRVSFVLSEGLQIKKLALLDTVTEGQGKGGKDDSGFDADVAIATGELRLLIPDLIEALGGESERGIGAGGAGGAGTVAAAAGTAAARPGAGQGAAPAVSGLGTKPGTGSITGPAKAPVDTAPEDAPF